MCDRFTNMVVIGASMLQMSTNADHANDDLLILPIISCTGTGSKYNPWAVILDAKHASVMLMIVTSMDWRGIFIRRALKYKAERFVRIKDSTKRYFLTSYKSCAHPTSPNDYEPFIVHVTTKRQCLWRAQRVMKTPRWWSRGRKMCVRPSLFRLHIIVSYLLSWSSIIFSSLSIQIT